MLDTYVFGWIICAALSAFAIRNFVFAVKKCCASLETDAAMCAENITTAAGECRSSKRDGEVDVVIAGAGVAGSALAYTLGKVPHELHDAFITAEDKGSIRTMPKRSLPATPHPTLGALLMGDALNMRHPLTRGGMTVALSDIVVLRNLLRPLRA